MKILLGLLSIFVIFTILSTTFGNRHSLAKEEDPVQSSANEIKVYKEQDVQLLIQSLSKSQRSIPVTPGITCLDKNYEQIDYLKKYVGGSSCPSQLKKWNPSEPEVDMKTLSAKAPNNTHNIPIARGNT